jgi:hypothetical protein
MYKRPVARRPGPRPGKTARCLARPGSALTSHGRHAPATGPDRGPRTRPVVWCQSGPWKGTARWRPGLPTAQSALYIAAAAGRTLIPLLGLSLSPVAACQP